ncbi:9-cis-epoxycarotenoid dioxygenase NCED6, chloroplastic [Andrographis paniculata]|uniref:9-cis-epoxycarotenoid dioxygenase NCED6, chloroplastic n=1 Tax=Andrographis paniculata TaxID=175694 RepID=UPI0021E7FBF3|nr:9-cis-epoxycarotenoid dioxygenase NCED6, chloroplastic [Andrographis paniculata]
MHLLHHHHRHRHSPFPDHKKMSTKRSHSCVISCKILPPRPQPPNLLLQKQSTSSSPPFSLLTPFSPPHLNPLQRIAAAALDLLETFILIKLERNQITVSPTIDPAVQLAGNFAPVQECPVRHDLQVVGTIPKTLQGVYLRNGGNPFLPPTGGHHLFDGDSMIHALTLNPTNRATYACRFTRTNRLIAEAGLGRNIFLKPIGELRGHLGLARLALFGARAMVGLVDESNGVGLANAGLVYFNGRILAMSEEDLPYIVRVGEDGDLETIQRYDFDGQINDKSLIAHPKVDPETGDFYTLSYNVLTKPYLKFFKFSKWGEKAREIEISLPHPTMVHDFAISESHVIIPDHQIVFKLSEMLRGGPPLMYEPSKVARFGVLPKNAADESMMQWIQVPGCFCFHMYNAWEEYNKQGHKIIVVISSRMTPPDSIFSDGSDEPLKTELCEIRLNLATNESAHRVIVGGMNLEGGQVEKRVVGKKARYVYLAIADPWPKCSGIARVDLSSGEVTKYLYGEGKYGGEPCVAGGDGDGDGDEGYVMSFVRDEEMETSEFVIVKASTMEQVALIKLPARVPYGFHGTFITSQELSKQAFA